MPGLGTAYGADLPPPPRPSMYAAVSRSVDTMPDHHKRTALIIGGTGQIGTAAARRLAGDGWSVLLAHRGEHTGDPTLNELDVTTVRLDRENTDKLLEVASGHDLVVDTVAYNTAHADQLARLAGDVGSLVVISTGSVYVGRNGSYLDIADDEDPEAFPDYPIPLHETDPTVDNDKRTYSPLKAAMERRLLASKGLPVSILRPGAIHGLFNPTPREWYFVKRALDGRSRIILSNDGQSRFSTSSTVNIAELIALCAARPARRVLNAVEEDTLTVAEIADTIFSAMGHNVEIVTFPGTSGALGSTPWSTARPLVLSMDAAKAELGYRQPVDYATSVRSEIRMITRAVAEAADRHRPWQEAFPALVSKMGADTWFDYAAEDAFTSSLN